MRPLLPVLLLAAACSPAARLKIEAKRDTRTLAEAADGYWSALRWNDVAAASGYLATPAEQLKLARAVSDPRMRLTEAAVVQVVVGEPLPDDRLPETREGVAVVRVEAYDVVSGRAQILTLEQHWVRSARSWVVDAERWPLAADRPWSVAP